jgi:LytTr DNA-binding domain
MWQSFFLKENIRIRWIFSVLCSIYIVAFNTILRPLENSNFHFNYPFYYNIYAVLGFIIIQIILFIGFPYWFPSFYEQKNWTFKRFIICSISFALLSSLFGFVFDYYACHFELTFPLLYSYFFEFQLPSDIFIVLSVLFFFLVPNPFLVKKQIFINDIEVTISESCISKPSSIKITDNYSKSIKDFEFEQLYYIASADNYIEVIWGENCESLNRILIRNTLKAIEEEYQDVPLLFRCHKGYIINCHKVISVEGNAKGYFLELKDITEKIPVSRNKRAELENLFSHLI